VLKEIKQDAVLKLIPVIVLSTSDSQKSILKTYSLHANCYITKPTDWMDFTSAIKQIETFWLGLVKLPHLAN
jgi:chemotaxis family two-component system response regulator Rcp1